MSLSETIEGMQTEATPETGAVSFAEDNTFAPTGGAWPRGQYPATIVAEGQRKNSVVRTEDVPSKDGTSRNLFIALQLTDPATIDPNTGSPRTKFDKLLVNYRPSDITNYAERKAIVEAAKQRNAGLPMGQKWDDPDAQRTFLSLEQLKDLQKNVEGFTPAINGSGGFNTAPLVGQAGTVNYGIGKDGFNRVNSLRKFSRG